MTNMNFAGNAIMILALMLFVLPKHVEAYIDPGTGSYLYQLLLAGLFGGMFFMSTFVKKIIRKFRKKGVPKATPINDK